MTYDPRKRDSTWAMFQPGCYLDPAGRAHLFPDEVIAYLQHAHPEANFEMSDRELVVKTFVQAMREVFPDVQIHYIQHEREAS
jgi:hypothetical protein